MGTTKAMTDVLFTITEEQLETGMRGYPVGYCTTSSVDPQKGLHYAGIPVAQIADWRPEEVIYLLYHGEKGNTAQVDKFSKEIQQRSRLSDEVKNAIRRLPAQGDAMKLFAAALLICGIFNETGDWREDCLNVIATLPEIAATVINHHAGWGENNPSKPELGYMENFAQMLCVPNADLDALTEVMTLFNVLHYDHGGGNLSAFTGKAVASGAAGMYYCLSAAMCSLAGSKHGKANQDSLKFVKGVLETLGENATQEMAEEYIRQCLASDKLIFGFGHAVLRVEDTRATHLYSIAEKRFPKHPLVKTTLLLRKAAPKVLGENPKIADPYPNVDAISGTVLTAAGFPYSEYYTVLFGLSRCVGISRQIVYERTEARDGKGTPIIRPKYYYKPKKSV